MVTKRRYLVYMAMFAMNMLNYADRINLSMAAGSIAATFDLSPIQMGYMFSSFLWTYLICLIPAGLAVDSLGARKVTAIAVIVWSVGGLVGGLASSFLLFLGARLILGIGESASYPAGGRIVKEWAPATERGFAASLLNAGAYAGPALGSIVVGWLITRFGWRGSFIATGGVGIVFGALWWLMYRTPGQASWLTGAERAEIAANSETPVVSAPSNDNIAGLKRLLTSKSMWGLALTQGCAGYTLYLFLTWLPTYLERARGLSVLKSGFYSSVPYLTACVLGIALGWLSDRMLGARARNRGGRRNLIMLMMLLATVILATPFVKSTILIIAIICAALTCVATAMAMNIALTNDLLRNPSYSGVSTGLLILGGNVFGLAAPIVTGYAVASAGGFSAAFSIAGALLFAGAVICCFMTRDPIDLGDNDSCLAVATEAR
jgi:MFS transporter, ACS family, D-galactonate transporter